MTTNLSEPVTYLRVPADAADITFLESAASSLEELHFLGDAFPPEQLEVLARLPQLRSVILHGPRITDESLRPLAEVPKLSTLWLFGTSVTDAGIEAFTASPLKKFLLSDLPNPAGRVTDRTLATLVKDHPQLEVLILGATAITDEGFRHIAKLKNLRTLYLEHCSFSSVSGVGLDYLRELPSLAKLSLARAPIKDSSLDPLQHMASLTFLGLKGTPITDAAIPILMKIPNLKQCSCEETGFSAGGLEQLAKHLEAKRVAGSIELRDITPESI